MNWKRNSLTVRSPKTAAHEGHAVRIVPIEGVPLSILQELLDASPLGVDAMIPMLRDSTVNLRTQLSKIVARTGLKPRPRMFQIRRASCECDWVERHPNYEVASWMGHSTLITTRHYLQASDKHFDLATGFDSRIQKPAKNPATLLH